MPRCESEVGQSAAAFAHTLQDCARSFCTRRGFGHEKREVGRSVGQVPPCMLPCASGRCEAEGGQHDKLCSAAPTATKACRGKSKALPVQTTRQTTVSCNHVGSQSAGMQGGAHVIMRV